MTTLKILAGQISIPETLTVEAKLEHLQSTVEKANTRLAKTPADVLLLPELSSLHYSKKTFEQLDTLAELDDGSSFQTWREVATRNNCWVAYGYARQRNNNSRAYSIATGIIDPSGNLNAVYEKLHLAQFGASEEKDYFSIAGEKLVVFEVNGFRLAPIICYDIRFAELCRTLVLQYNVDCILHTGAYARDPSFDSWHAFVKTRAMENQVYLISLNRAGEYFGNSVCMPPWVDENHLPTHFPDIDEEFRLLSLNRETIDYARREYHFLDDRLETYDFPV